MPLGSPFPAPADERTRLERAILDSLADGPLLFGDLPVAIYGWPPVIEAAVMKLKREGLIAYDWKTSEVRLI